MTEARVEMGIDLISQMTLRARYADQIVLDAPLPAVFNSHLATQSLGSCIASSDKQTHKGE